MIFFGFYVMIEAEIRYFVLDKSVLQGCRLDVLESIARSSARFVMTAEHYMEVCTTDDQKRKELLGKLHGLSRHIDLLDHIGTLYKYEINKQRPCSPVTKHFAKGVLNPNFTFQFTDEQDRIFKEERDYLENRSANEFQHIVKEIAMKNQGLDKKNICHAEVVRQVYSRLRVQASKLPPAELLDEHWAIYRKVQVDLLATFDYSYSYNGSNFCIRQEKMAHNQIDFRLCIVGALVGGLATRDKIMRRYFQTICPSGWLEPPIIRGRGDSDHD